MSSAEKQTNKKALSVLLMLATAILSGLLTSFLTLVASKSQFAILVWFLVGFILLSIVLIIISAYLYGQLNPKEVFQLIGGVYFDEKMNPFCPDCDKAAKYCEQKFLFYSNSYEYDPHFVCPSDHQFFLRTINNEKITLDEWLKIHQTKKK